EYPRPQLKRQGNWKNLNGLWKYTIVDKDVSEIPAQWDGDILVPFAVESALSGVGKAVGKDKALWYQNEIEIPKSLRKGRVLIHFGAVDWQSDLYVNGQHIGRHEGVFNPFSSDSTDALSKSGKRPLTLRVWDPTSDGPQPRGKQINTPHSIWYTPVTGIWQTVWIESVSESYIVSTKHTPDVDRSVLHFSARVENAQADDQIVIEAFDGDRKIAEVSTAAQQAVELPLSDVE